MAAKIGHGDRQEQEQHEALLKHIEHALAGMRFGSVEIVVHAGKVMQVERRDKYSCPPTLSTDFDSQ
ncbi:YezD family protein [Methyloterricola oryzae]|uniref:YezD family protein n=1 Tax=Methyloterricola oryzae TaxID=1495050 RepID=UPI0005EAF078|nr:YezD family protein [Methyloterricola oryzae]